MTNPGLFFTAMSFTMIICRALGARILDTCAPRTIITTFRATLMAGLLLLSFSSMYMMFILVGVIFGVSYAYLMPSFMARATRDSGTFAAAAVGTFLGFSDAGLALGPMIMGAVTSTVGYSMMFLCTALIACVNLFYSRFFVTEKQLRQDEGVSA